MTASDKTTTPRSTTDAKGTATGAVLQVPDSPPAAPHRCKRFLPLISTTELEFR